MERKTSAARRDFYVRVSARFLKDPNLSPEAKLLRVILAAYADARTGRTFVGLVTLERLMGCARKKRGRAQRELVKAGWLRLEWQRIGGSSWARREFVLCEPEPSTTGQIARCAEKDQLISHQSQVSHQLPKVILTKPQAGDLT